MIWMWRRLLPDVAAHGRERSKMACRCRDLERCRQDRVVLGRAQMKARWLPLTVSCMQTKLQSLADGSMDAYTTDNIEEICNAIVMLDDDIEPALEGLIAAIESKKEELEELISRLEKEDRNHHEAERMAAQQEET